MTAAQPVSAPDTLHYDGRCPLCMREIRLLRRIAGPGLALVDLHQVPDQRGHPGRLTKLTTLHLQTAEGEWLTGVDDRRAYRAACEAPTPGGPDGCRDIRRFRYPDLPE